MTRLLAWDTSSKAGAIVAMEWDKDSPLRLVSELALNVEATHSEKLLWGIHQLLESSRWKVNDVDVFGVGIGPGSFTGLRIGIATARTLAHTLEKPLVAVSSLAALARPAALHFSEFKKSFKTLLIASTDACKGEFFGLWGEAQKVSQCAVAPESALHPSLWKRGVHEEVLTPQDLVDRLKKELKSKGFPLLRWAVVGEGRGRYPEIWAQLPRSQKLEIPFLGADCVQGRYLGLLAYEAFQAGQARPPLEVTPRYLRASDAEKKLKREYH